MKIPKKNNIVNTERNKQMKIKMQIYGYGSEYRAGYIPEKTWKYIQDECEGDASVYNEKLDDGEVPDEFKLAENSAEYYDAYSFFEGYAPYYDANLVVYDENDKEIADISLTDEELDIDTEPNTTKLEANKPYFVWESVEKGCWDVINEDDEDDEDDDDDDDELIEIDGEFDVNKLKIHLDKLRYNNNCKGFAFVSAIEYDGKIYNVSLNSTRGMSLECNFYEDSEED